MNKTELFKLASQELENMSEEEFKEAVKKCANDSRLKHLAEIYAESNRHIQNQKSKTLLKRAKYERLRFKRVNGVFAV